MLLTSLRRSGPRRRSGFTFFELMIAMTVSAIVMAIALPRSAPARDGAGVRSAKQAAMSYLALARQTAMRRGGTAEFKNVSGVLSVTSTVEGVTSVVVPPVDVGDQHGVTLTSGITTITYRPRGFASPRLAQSTKMYFSRGGRSDSLCVTILGMAGKCGL